MEGPVNVIDCQDSVSTVTFCPFHWCRQLVLVGTWTRGVITGTCKFQDECAEVDGVEFTHLRDFHHATRVTALACSPETSLLTVPKVLRFCSGGADKKLRIFTSDLKTQDTVKLGEGHTDYINDVKFDPDKGELLVSVSDDHTCRVWTVDGEQRMCFPLESPGTSVCWHKDEPMKILVGTKRGLICMYNLATQRPIMSFHCDSAPLLSVAWSPFDVLRVAAIGGTDCFVFDTSMSSQPMSSKQVHSEGGHQVAWSEHHNNMIATLGAAGNNVKVLNILTNEVNECKQIQAATGLSWYSGLPILAIAADQSVYFWQVSA